MNALDNVMVSFVVIFLASLLMFGEVLVRVKGVFGCISFILFLLYFIHRMAEYSPALMLTLLVVGFALILLDGKLINHGSVAILGLILMLLAVALPTPSIGYGTVVAAAFILGIALSFAFLKVFPARAFWSKITLLDQLSSEQGYNSMNEEYKFLVGKRGKSVTPFRPVGTIEIEGKTYSAITNGTWLESDQKIKVLSVDGTRIVIQADEE
ncbi:hypothetical protein GCM10011391_27210 [Pullulanibacillus camelliae]|uniref:Nodulation protein NfeD n=1 Tax=Pullulanibacillus camelliae TaxID=1707096 RepID=A0A8J3DV25_9BACL|nr:NfeD family protein [Pullulanibacillus camelliae]GGE46926.1 hypothetical protein GCM10011391_27210 [Pullulanibacillus camelliae]